MQIYIIRHAIAELRENWGQSDEERPLTEEGRKKMERIARGLRNMKVTFSHLYSSPLVRAQQTAEIVGKKITVQTFAQTDLLVPEADPARLLPFLNEHEEEAALALVGHEPHVSSLLSFLLAGKPGSFVYFKKGGVALIEGNTPVQAGQCTLRWLLEPRHLTAIAGK